MLPDAVPEPIQRRLADYASLLRIDRPIGTLLLLWPTYWALWLAGDGSPALANVIIFTLGVFFMRAAGCAINDFADRNLDGQVERTRNRPLATGEISAHEALAVFLVLLGALASAVTWGPRPQMLTMGLAAAFTYILARYRAGRRWVIWQKRENWACIWMVRGLPTLLHILAERLQRLLAGVRHWRSGS